MPYMADFQIIPSSQVDWSETMAARGGAYIAKVKKKNQVSDSRAILALLFFENGVKPQSINQSMSKKVNTKHIFRAIIFVSLCMTIS